MNIEIKKYKQYMVFFMCRYYPTGGLDDCEGSFDTLKEVAKFIKDNLSQYQRVEVFDRVKGVKILEDFNV